MNIFTLSSVLSENYICYMEEKEGEKGEKHSISLIVWHWKKVENFKIVSIYLHYLSPLDSFDDDAAIRIDEKVNLEFWNSSVCTESTLFFRFNSEPLPSLMIT